MGARLVLLRAVALTEVMVAYCWLAAERSCVKAVTAGCGIMLRG